MALVPISDQADRAFREGYKLRIGPIKTHKMHIDDKRVQGHIVDELEALKQMCYKCVNTEKGEYIIYPHFGVKKKDLFFRPKLFAYEKLKFRIREALMRDDRVKDVIDFKYHRRESVRGDLVMSFTVVSIYGEFRLRRVIRLG